MNKKMMKMMLSALICFSLLLNGAFASVHVLASEVPESDLEMDSEAADEAEISEVPDTEAAEESDAEDVPDEVSEPDVFAVEDDSEAADLQESDAEEQESDAEEQESDAEEQEPDAVEPEAETAESCEYLEPWVNPVYADLYAAGAFQLKPMADFDGQLPIARATAYTTIEAAGTYVREQLRLRAETITVSYAHGGNYDPSCWDEIFEVAFQHTGKPDEGDYINYNFGGYGAPAFSEPDNNTVTLTFMPTYFTTAAQETAMNSAVASAMSQLALSGKSDYEKIRAIHDYIVEKVTYDTAHLSQQDTYLLQFTAYAALIDGAAVYKGYAQLTYRLMLEAGIDCRIITGVADDGFTTGGAAWNIVKLNGKYYYLDVTWDDFSQSDDCFLKCALSDHRPDYNFSDEFFAKYPLADTDFLADASNITSTSVNFDGKLFLNVYIVPSAEIKADAKAYVRVLYNGNTSDYNVKELMSNSTTYDSQGRIRVGQEAYAGMMREVMTLQMYNGKGQLMPLTYKVTRDVTGGFQSTVLEYLKGRQESSTNPKMVNLARAAELYGIAVQVNFTYKTEQLTSADISTMKTEAGKITIPSSCAKQVTGTLPDGISRQTSTVVFEADNTLRLYYYLDDANLSKYTFKLNGKTVSAKKLESGKYYIEQNNIASGNLSTVYTFSVTDGKNTHTVKSSVLGYAYDRQENSTNANMRNLVKLLYLYSQAADAYFE